MNNAYKEDKKKETLVDKWSNFSSEHGSLAFGLKATGFVFMYMFLILITVGLVTITAWTLVITIPILIGIVLTHMHYSINNS